MTPLLAMSAVQQGLHQTTIDVSRLLPGIYLVVFETNKREAIKKLVVQR
jgi:hypothetical protein